jgi:hypothetical protein
MYLKTLRRHHAYLSGLVVKNGDTEQLVVRPLGALSGSLPAGFSERDGLVYHTGPGGRESLFDAFGVYDPLEGRVEGDHYATSHYVLMSAALHRLTGEPEYLQAAVDSAAFCFRILQGYPRVPWGMHFDFNNYGIALTCLLLREILPEETRAAWLNSLASARMNKHRVGNWFGQRLVFLSLLRAQGVRLPLRLRLLLVFNLLGFRRSFAADGAIEDHKGTSRPIQYHAFSLALAVLLDAVVGDAWTARRIDPGIDFLLRFLAPDGDFNFFGRGHKQIFAYSPALYILEALAPVRPELRDAADLIWGFVHPHQRGDGSFPLVLTPSEPDSQAVPHLGWYDYHRHSVYNAFFGAWLALAELGRRGELRPGRWAPARQLRREPLAGGKTNVFSQTKSSYYLCLTRGYGGYSSECALSPHKLYLNGLGTLLSCPGGPALTQLGFGCRFIFAQEPVNIFAPLWRKLANTAWQGPGGVRTPLAVLDGRPVFSLTYGPLRVDRRFALMNHSLEIRDTITIEIAKGKVLSEGAAVRLINLPLNVHGKTWILDGGHILLLGERAGANIDIHVSGPQEYLEPLYHAETYSWVDGEVALIVMEAPLTECRHEIFYRISAVSGAGH